MCVATDSLNELDDDENNGKEAGAGTLGIFITLAATSRQVIADNISNLNGYLVFRSAIAASSIANI